jgi:hypothetical protein
MQDRREISPGTSQGRASERGRDRRATAIAALLVRADQGAGVPVEKEPYQPGQAEGDLWLATFKDPDGNFFQIASPMPTQYRPSVGA